MIQLVMAAATPEGCFYRIDKTCLCSISIFFQQPCPCKGQGCEHLEEPDACENNVNKQCKSYRVLTKFSRRNR